MKTKKWIKASMLLMVAALFAACANEDVAQDKKKENGTEAPKGGVIFAANGPKVSAKRLSIDGEDEFAGAKTRTNIKHTPGNGADAYWTVGDFIWVKKQDGTWAQSTNITLHDGGASAEFTLPGNKTDYADGCEVRYTGTAVTAYGAYNNPRSVGIYPIQSRTTANDFSKAGEWGDCGSGVARNTGNPEKFNFTLEHKPAYLCFLPRCENATLAPNIRLLRIKITATKVYFGGAGRNILADLYNFTDGENLLRGVSPFGSDYIEVTLLNNVPLYTDVRQEANATYLVVPPDKYDFKIEYTIRDPTTNGETVITDTKTNITLDKGKIYDVTANLSPKSLNYTPKNFKYHMWDAPYDYWYGYENEQPTTEGAKGQHYPNNMSDPRWYNRSYPGHGIRNDAQTSIFQPLPNANELWWYIYKGDPHWTEDVYEVNGHLGRFSGLWLRKKSAIVAYLKTQGYPSNFSENNLKESYKDSPSATPVDYRYVTGFINNYIPAQGTPASTTDYFFLPALGSYYEGQFNGFGTMGMYWSSSAATWGGFYAYYLSFSRNGIYVGSAARYGGYIPRVFE